MDNILSPSTAIEIGPSRFYALQIMREDIILKEDVRFFHCWQSEERTKKIRIYDLLGIPTLLPSDETITIFEVKK
jgi:hypothetical protein|tara:strand:+ start:117 stop:341 length:225 start_codon:yes stop_codon:yes gene_type:complete